jgi:AcrR family transcriptional regulator
MTATRRRGAALEGAILDAGWDQLMDGGYAGFTYEAIAERARTSKTVLYRRWPDKEALLLAVLGHRGYGVPAAAPDTGSLREDVLTLLRRAGNLLGEGGAALFSTLVGSYYDETRTSPAELRTRLLGDRSLAMTQIVDRAMARGEITAPLPPRVVALPIDLFRHEVLMTLGRVPDEVIVDIVDSVFLPLATDPRRAVPARRRPPR